MREDAVISVHYRRVSARRRERELQRWLDAGRPAPPPGSLPGAFNGEQIVPEWARGIRVSKAGRFQWVVVATESPGH